MRNNYPNRPLGTPFHTSSNLYGVPIGIYHPLICGSVLLNLWTPRVVVTRYWMIFHVLHNLIKV